MSKKDIGVIDIVDNPDGSAILSMDVEPAQVSSFAHTGLRYLIEQVRLQHDMSEILPNTFEESALTIELTNEEFNALFQFGIITAFKRGMDDYEQNNEEETNKG